MAEDPLACFCFDMYHRVVESVALAEQIQLDCPQAQ